MKLLLLQPPIEDFYDTEIRLQPVGLCLLKAAVRKHIPHMQVRVRDFHRGWGRYTAVIPQELAYLRDYYAWPDKSPFSTFHQYYHFGAPCAAIAVEVEKEQPDIVGISSLFSPYYREVFRTAEEIKRRISVPIVVGGPHVSAAAEMMLKHPAIDFVISGEGERPLVELLQALLGKKDLSHVPNLGYKQDGQLCFNPMEENYPLDEIPWPDLGDFQLDHYQYAGRPMTVVLTSRSCPYQCSFCSVDKVFGRRYRRRKTEDVMDEIRLRYESGYRVFDFEDDNLTAQGTAAELLFASLAEEFGGRDVEFTAMNGLCCANLSRKMLSLMRRAGFSRLNLSLVSAEDSLLRQVRRGQTLKEFLSVVEDAFSLGFSLTCYQILGLPLERISSMVKTLQVLSQLPVLIGASVFYCTPGTAIAEELGVPQGDAYLKSRSTALAVEAQDFFRADLYTLFLCARIVNFIKSIEFTGLEISFPDLLRGAASSDTRTDLGVKLLHRLLGEQKLFAATPQGEREFSRFQYRLFESFWQGMKVVRNQKGQRIRLNSWG